MPSNAYPWQINLQQEPLFNASYGLTQLAKGVSFLQQPWLCGVPGPRILVTGAGHWLARYLLHVITENVGLGEILAVDESPPPEFIETPRYREVRYRSSPWTEMPGVIREFRPHLIFHANYVWDVHYRNTVELYETNILACEQLCKAATEAGVQRVILFSDAVVYGPDQEFASETAPLKPASPLAKSFQEAERVAQEYHLRNGTKIYHLRVGALYGPAIPLGVMAIAHLMAEGILLGPIENSERKVSIVSGQDMALAAFLLSMAHDPGHRIFNVVGETLPLSELLHRLAELLPKAKVMGFRSRLAGIMKIGYQEEISLPAGWLKFVGHIYHNATDFLNQMRFFRKKPDVTREMLDYLFQIGSISGTRLKDTLGWSPGAHPKFWESSVGYLAEHGERLFRIPSPRQEAESDLSRRLALLDTAVDIAESLGRYSPGANETVFSLSQIACELDIKSLWILREKCWNRVLLSLFRSNPSSRLTILWPELSSWLQERILTLIRYEQSRARRKFPEDLAEQVKWLGQQIGGLNLQRLKFYATVALIGDVVQRVSDWAANYRQLLLLLPEKNYGLFLADDHGDIGVVFQVKDGEVKIQFPRKQVDAISRADYLSRRLAEFKKSARLHIALGVKLDKLISDATAGSLLQSIVHNFGSDYLLSEGSDYYELIGHMLKETPKNLYLFVDKGKAVFGVWLRNNTMEMVESSYLTMVNTLLENMPVDEVVEMLKNASSGQEQAVFADMATVKRLLEGMMAPSLLRKLLLAILGRAIDKEKAKERKKELQDESEDTPPPPEGEE